LIFKILSKVAHARATASFLFIEFQYKICQISHFRFRNERKGNLENENAQFWLSKWQFSQICFFKILKKIELQLDI